MVVFGLEVLIKTAGLGMKLYLNDVWNRMDFIIFIFGIFSELNLGSANNITLFRTMRVLKPLRTI